MRLNEQNTLLATMVPKSELAEATARCDFLKAQLVDLRTENQRIKEDEQTKLSSLEAEKTQLLAAMQVDANRDITALFPTINILCCHRGWPPAKSS